MRRTRARAAAAETTTPSSSSSSDSRNVVELPYEIWERIIARIVRSEKFASYVEYVEHDTPEHYVMRLRGIDEEKLERVLISNIRDANYAAMLARQANDFRAKRCGKTKSRHSAARVKRFDAFWTDQSGEMCVERGGRR